MTQEIYNNAADVYSRLLELILDCYMGQMCEIGIDSYPWLFENVSYQYKAIEMY